ncbi:unnamed protein product, partial [marine sediment metagenome]
CPSHEDSTLIRTQLYGNTYLTSTDLSTPRLDGQTLLTIARERGANFRVRFDCLLSALDERRESILNNPAFTGIALRSTPHETNDQLYCFDLILNALLPGQKSASMNYVVKTLALPLCQIKILRGPMIDAARDFFGGGPYTRVGTLRLPDPFATRNKKRRYSETE